MADFPYAILPPPLFVTTWSKYAATTEAQAYINTGTVPASGAWVANIGIYVPVSIPWPYTVRRVFWVNGSTVTGNTDFGIYTAGGTRIYSTGPTSQTGFASVPQYTTPTAFVLSPGLYYFAASNNGTTNRMWFAGTVTAQGMRFCGMYQQASVATLPATATFATVTNALVPLIGVTSTSSGS